MTASAHVGAVTTPFCESDTLAMFTFGKSRTEEQQALSRIRAQRAQTEHEEQQREKAERKERQRALREAREAADKDDDG